MIIGPQTSHEYSKLLHPYRDSYVLILSKNRIFIFVEYFKIFRIFKQVYYLRLVLFCKGIMPIYKFSIIPEYEGTGVF